jgi:catechol 2,3-dioxygenase-like lactoylglutathione lyase family enzyme
MRATLLLFGLLGLLQARAADVIAPAAPQFFALSVPDAPASARWYAEAFGLKVLADFKPDDNGHVIILQSDTLLLEILQLRPARSPGGAVVKDRHLTHGIFKIGFHVSDLEGAVRKLREMKAQFDTDIVDDRAHNLRFALLRDPHGNWVQIFGKPK